MQVKMNEWITNVDYKDKKIMKRRRKSNIKFFYCTLILI